MTGDDGVARLEAASGVQFRHITAARTATERRLVERRSQIAAVQVDEDAAVVLMGSWGRREVTSESDDDFMVLLAGAPREDARPSIEEVAGALGGPPPGPEEIFGRHVLLHELRERIGRDEDTNTNLTRRMLLMLESVAICGGQVHADARRALTAGYLEANVKDHRPPRFLLNDVVRYWRTRVRIAGQLTRLGRPADALAIVEEVHADEPEDEDLQTIRAAALMVAYERVTAEPDDPDLPGECPCLSGQAWTPCCRPAEEAALARFEDRGPLRTLRSTIERYVTLGRDHRPAVADDVRRWLEAAQITDEQLADPVDLQRMAEEHAWLIGAEDNDPSSGQLFDLDSPLASFAADPSTPGPRAAAARRWIEHHSYGLWQVREPEARPGVWLTELVTGAKRYAAIPPELLEPVGRWTVLLGGLVAVDGTWRPVTGMLPLRPREADEAVELVQELSYTVASSASGRKAPARRDRGGLGQPHGVLAAVTEPSTPLVARFISMVIGSGMPQLLAFVARLREEQPKMVNTDKDPLCMIRATVAVTDTAEVVARLSRHPDFRVEDGTITWWGRELDALERETSRAELRAMLNERGETTELSEPDTAQRWIRGSLTIGSDGLEVDVNSRERLERLLTVLTEIGSAPEVAKQLVIDPAQDMALPRIGSVIGAVSSEEAEEAWRRHWPDEQVPALGGMTPRRAARSEQRKPWLEALLREMEHDADQLAHRGRRAPDVESLRAELGMPANAFA